MRATFRVEMDKRVLERLIREAPGRADDAVEALGREGEAFVKRSFGAGPGASAPGAPPNVQSGTLKAGITLYRPAMLQRILASSAEYGPHLEFGTRRMAARPFMAPAVVYLQDLAPRLFDGFLEK